MGTVIQNSSILALIKEDRKYFIKKILDEQKILQEKARNIEAAFKNFFSHLFTSAGNDVE